MTEESDGLFEEIFNEQKSDYGCEISTAEYVDGIRDNTVPSQLNSFNDTTVYPLRSSFLTQSQNNTPQYESETGLLDTCDETPIFKTSVYNSHLEQQNSTCAIPNSSLLEEVTSPFRICGVGVYAGRIIYFHINCILID